MKPPKAGSMPILRFLTRIRRRADATLKAKRCRAAHFREAHLPQFFALRFRGTKGNRMSRIHPSQIRSRGSLQARAEDCSSKSHLLNGRPGGEQAEFAGVRQSDRFVAFGFEVVNLACVKGAGVNVESDRAGGEGRRVDDNVDWLLGVNLGRILGVDDIAFRGSEFTKLRRGVLADEAVVLHLYFTEGYTHPATLIGVVVDPALLPDLPADGDEIEERRVKDEVSSVVLGAEVKEGIKARDGHGIFAHEFKHGAVGKLLFRDFAELGGEGADIDH